MGRGITLVEEIQTIYSLSGAVWALCVIGSMAEEHAQLFFKKVFTDLIEDSGRFGNSLTAFKIVQECWAKQREDNGQGLAIKDSSVRALLI